MTTAAAARPAIITIIAVSLVSAIGGIPFNTMPLMLATLGESLNLSDQRVGLLGSSAFAGFLAGTLTCPFWVDRVNWRHAAMGGSVLAAFAFLLSSAARGIALNISWIAIGFFCALLIGLGMRILADQANKERAYGMRTGIELISISLLLLVLPVLVIAKYQYQGAAIAMAGFVLMLGAASFWMPAKSSETVLQSEEKGVFKAPPYGWAALALFLVYLAGNIGLWVFLGRIAQTHDATPEQTGLLFSVLKVIGGASVLGGAWLGARAGVKLPHLVCFAVVVFGALLLWLAPNFMTFAFGAWIWEAGFTLGCLYQTAAIARFDPTNKLVVLVPAAFAISSMLGSSGAGYLSAAGGYSSLYLMAVVISALPTLAYFLLFPVDETAPDAANAKASTA